MNTIKNLGRLAGIVPDIEAVDKGADVYKRHGGIEFKVLNVAEQKLELVVQVIQTKHSTDKYLERKELIERAKSLFAKFLPEWTIHVHATPYEAHPSQQVTPEWILARMEERGMKLKDLVELVGLEKSNVSAWTTGTRPMSNIVKSLMYHVLKCTCAFTTSRK